MPKSYIPSNVQIAQITAEAVYKKWVTDLRELKGITDPRIKAWWIQDLEELHALAQSLIDGGLVSGIPASQLQLVVSRSVSQWLPLAK